MTTTLPAVTLRDPWASLCVAGIKTLETRKGAILSGFTGPLVIHRSKAPCDPYDLSPYTAAWQAHMWGTCVPRPDSAGMALGVVYVERTWRHAFRPGDAEYADFQRRACFNDIEGRYLSELTRATWFPAPVPARGQQCRFRIDVPTEYLPEWAR